MNKIDQNFYQDNKLNFGSFHTELRNRVWDYRWDSIISVMAEKYPEYALILMDRKSSYAYGMRLEPGKINFKDKYKLDYGLNYCSLEAIDATEFKLLARRFRRYIEYAESSKAELKVLFKKN